MTYKTQNEINAMSQAQARTYLRELNRGGHLSVDQANRAALSQFLNGQLPGFTTADTKRVAAERRFPAAGMVLPPVGETAPKATKPAKPEPVVAPEPVVTPEQAIAVGPPACAVVAGEPADKREQLLRELLSGGLSEADVVAIVNKTIAAKLPDGVPTETVVVKNGAAKKGKGATHRVFGQLVKLLGAGEDTYCHGPAGTGKTELGRQLAEALGLDFYFTSKISAEHHFQGFVDGGGKYHETPFFKAFTQGGLFRFDEMDASNPNVLTRLNAALANRRCDFPHGMYEAHDDFVCLGAGNTTLAGASREYNARSQQDSALIDRFLFVEVGYDEKLERQLASQYEGGIDVAKRVQSIRKAIGKLKIRHAVTMRATIKCAKLLAAGLTVAQAEQAAIWKGLDAASIRKVETEVEQANSAS